MKAIVKTKKEPGIEVLDVENPAIGETDILVKVGAGSVCGSDVHVYEWTPGYDWIPLPVVLGHEFSGQVVEVGAKIRTVKVGERVTAHPYMPCSRCAMCQIGKPDSCMSPLGLGLISNGAFAEYLRLTAAARIYHLPDNVSYEAAALCEPLSVALHAIETSNIKPGDKAAILGPGPIGLLTLQSARAAGASIIIVTGTAADGRRLEVARKLGADITIDVGSEDPVKKVMELTGGTGLDFVFEATGDPKSIPQALSMVRPMGKVILIGIHSGPAEFNPTEVVRGAKSIVGSYAYAPETWDRALIMLSTGRIAVEPMITHRIPLIEATKGFDLAVRKEAAKVLFIP